MASTLEYFRVESARSHRSKIVATPIVPTVKSPTIFTPVAQAMAAPVAHMLPHHSAVNGLNCKRN